MPKRKLDFRRSEPVRLPNGRTTTISYIRHPGAVIIAPFMDKDGMVLMRQYRPALRAYIYELPAGTLDPDESLVTCARRELIEETGLRARTMTKLGRIYPVPGYSTEIIHIFRADGLIQGAAEPEDYEVIRTMIVSRAEVGRMFRTGKLQDAKSICALAHCGWL